MESNSPIRVGSRVYLKNAICGFPGCVVGFDRKGYALIYWDDLDLGRNTAHKTDSLVLDEAFCVKQLDIDFGEQAA
jgi:hypothetical protein